MATEDIRIENGRVLVERIEGKENIDVELSKVDVVTFTRGVGGGDGALVFSTEDGESLIRVANDDAPEVLERIYAAKGDGDKDQPDLLAELEGQRPENDPAIDATVERGVQVPDGAPSDS